MLPAGLVLAVLLCGCVTEAATPTPTPIPVSTATPAPTPTVVVIWRVQVTSIPPTPTPHLKPLRPKRRTTPTPVPRGPYLQLFPPAGPPVSRTVWVKGVHLLPRREVQLLWSPGGHLSPVGTTAYTDRKGNLWSRFTIPGSPPGLYQIVADIDGVPQAGARYRVVSAAHLSVQVTSTGRGELLQVWGAKFIPGTPLVLIVYPVVRGHPPLLIGTVRSGLHGRFQVRQVNRKLVPGQYILRVWSSETAQTAEMPFQVVV
jgi:hypothetical protein